ncbi:Septin-type guanine nucleotide-binding (G) domain-containing protein [Phycomyces nitens]|nr:Septin-type guanine nucleotide-binding (G) domain-containing protein [Phycomyces nitens]
MSPRPKKNTPTQFNVMVVGFGGVGKTAFLRTFLQALQHLHGASVNDDDGSGEITALQPTKLPSTVSVNIDSGGERLTLRLIDTPGLNTGYQMDKELQDILEYIEHQFDLTLTEESKVKRNPKAVDSQIHACLYFIDPSKTQLNEHDIRIISRLSKRVNVIPVIGKADTLTVAQRRRLKPAILHSIYNEATKIPLYGIPEDEEYESDEEETKKNAASLAIFLEQFNYDDEEEETQCVLDYLHQIPFGVIAYEEDPETGKPLETQNSAIKIGRDYGWGVIDCLSDQDSDLVSLMDVLLHSHRDILKSETIERYYEQYRTEKLLVRRATRIKGIEKELIGNPIPEPRTNTV